MRVGLVLGAGGVLGGAWLVGGLHALATETRWDPASADTIVGTSAGSMVGSLLASGVPPWFMVAHSAGEVFDGLVDAEGRPAEEADRSAGAVFQLERALPPIGPGSWGLALRSAMQPHRHTPAAVLAGWLPRGVFSTEPLKDTIRRVVPDGWAEHPHLWVVACDYSTGRRVQFGRDGAPPADLADAVAASCAIPSFYHPVEIGGRRYVDGGLYSNSNLDVLRAQELDLVVCLNPTSTLNPTHAYNPAEWLAGAARSLSGRRLGSEAKKLREAGTSVVLIQPTAEDIEVMGPNLMSTRRRHEVIETAIRTVREQLREPGVRGLLRKLPPGQPERIARPAGPPSTWPLPGNTAYREAS
ncbi:MAG TPA: patatin-like phospholipase family protein [Thermoleophilaceae bacterium]